MKTRLFLMVMGLMLVMFCSSSAQVPQLINYQGKLTKSTGAPLDTTIQMVFTIYADSNGVTSKWGETQTAVKVEKGVFNVLLGSINAIPDSVFDGSVRYLGVKVGGDQEITPRKAMVSVPYAYRAGTADGGQVHCHDCDTVFVNAVGPDSVVATTGTAFLGKASGSSSGDLSGIRGYADNNSSGNAYGGYFSASPSGTGNRFGVYGEGRSSSAWVAIGCEGFAENTSSGGAFGGDFGTSSSGTGGPNIGVSAVGQNASSGDAIGCSGTGIGRSTGAAYGGEFRGYHDASGTGDTYGIDVYASGSHTSTPTYGVHCRATNADPSTGEVYAGYYWADAGGTGKRYGIYGRSSNSSSSTSDSYGGYFKTEAGGATGNRFGVYGEGRSSSGWEAVGCVGFAENTSDGGATGGEFSTSSASSEDGGGNIGVIAVGLNASDSDAKGCRGLGIGLSTGAAYGGQFMGYHDPSGTGDTYGIDVYASGSHTSTPTYGVYCKATNTDPSTGNVYAGYFWGDVGGTGTHYGVYGREQAGGGGAAIYAAGDFAGSGAKYAVVMTGKGSRLLSCMESPEVWFEDFGEGQLVNGKAHIDLDPLFLETVTVSAQHPMKVFVQVDDENCRGTAVKRGTTGFDVIELQNGTSNTSFSYRIVAKRKGYETERLRATDVGQDDPNLHPELKAEMEQRNQEEEARIQNEMKTELAKHGQQR